MTTKVLESAVVPGRINDVWSILRKLDFSFSSIVKKSSFENGSCNEVGSVFTIEYKDGTSQKYRIMEVSELEHSVSYQLYESNPSITYLSQIVTIRVHHVTLSDSSYVEWVSEFSGDAGQDVIQDSKFKKHEAFKELINSLQ